MLNSRLLPQVRDWFEQNLAFFRKTLHFATLQKLFMPGSKLKRFSEMAWKLARYEPYSIESMWNQLKDEVLYSMSQYYESSTDRAFRSKFN